MRILTALALLCLVMAVVAKKSQKETVETESKSHSTKKYSREHQKSHHHNHKKHEEIVNEAEPRAKQAPIEVPEPEIELQENLDTSKTENLKDLHLQDLAYEENLKKKDKKKKKGHHGAHPADVVDKRSREADKKLFDESKLPVEDKVIEDLFEPLGQETPAETKRNKQQEKKKDKSKNKKKAYEKSKHGKKHKDGKKNKDKKH